MKRLLLISMLCLPMLAGCNLEQIEEATAAVEQISAGIQDIQAAVDEATAQRAALETVIAQMQPGPDRDQAVAMSAKLGTAIEVGTLWLDKAEVSIGILQDGLANADDPFDVAEGVLKAAQPFIPAPWGAIAIGLGGLVIGFIRARMNRVAGRNAVASVDPVVAKASASAKEDIASAQSTAAGRLVDEAQGKVLKLPF